MTGVVLDASAVLAFLLSEPGADVVAEAMTDAALSSVNYAEITSKLVERGDDADSACLRVARLGLDVVNFDQAQARDVAALRATTKARGLSLGDRACLALGRRLARPVMTGDRVWADLPHGVGVKLIR